jgi:hypothetical protein
MRKLKREVEYLVTIDPSSRPSTIYWNVDVRCHYGDSFNTSGLATGHAVSIAEAKVFVDLAIKDDKKRLKDLAELDEKIIRYLVT